MKTGLLFISVLLSIIFVEGQEILEVGIYRHINIRKALFSPQKHDYKIVVEDTIILQTLTENQEVVISPTAEGKVRLEQEGKELGMFHKVRFVPLKPEAYFKVKTVIPSTKRRIYYGDLEIKKIEEIFTFINHVPLEKYLIGVIESESGNYQSKEYYKVQAIISRTYALKNKEKFLHEGFMLTDLVNCQVYFGKFYQNPKMIKAVEETKGLVLVDDELQFITAAFYSNSGGQTENSENVWNKKVSYLRSIKDPFSVGKNNYKWVKRMPKERWLNYLQSKYQYPIEDSVALEKVLNFKQVNRKKYLAGWESHILLTDVRRDLRLKSTFFSIELEGNEVVFRGKGFGHGVGLSQEGAMNMVDLGYSYIDVLNFYYTNVNIIDLEKRNYYLLE